MAFLHVIKPAKGSNKGTKRVGRGQGSGMGKTSTRGGRGQTARSGYKAKRGFEGGQQPLQRRLPKVGFTTKIQKPYVINLDKIKAIATLDKLTIENIAEVHKLPGFVRNAKVRTSKDKQNIKTRPVLKIIGTNSSSLASKIDDVRISVSGQLHK